MILELMRERSTLDGTIGRLAVDGVFICYTLEPAEDRPLHPAIPQGRYRVEITMSRRFGRRLPIIIGVAGRTGIRIHPGNRDDDTEGCILLGMSRQGVEVLQSRVACEMFQSKIALPLAKGDPVILTIVNAPDDKALKA